MQVHLDEFTGMGIFSSRIRDAVERVCPEEAEGEIACMTEGVCVSNYKLSLSRTIMHVMDDL